MLPRLKAISGTLAFVTALALAVTFTGAVYAAPSTSNASPASFVHACGAATAGFAQCHAILNLSATAKGPTPNALTGCSNPSSGYTPCDLQSAYNISTSSTNTVAIVDAYNDPNAEADLGVYRSQFGLPACTTANGCFSKVNQTGGTKYPRNNGGWAQEISLDLDMVSALCPGCHILLVEASSNSFANLLAAEDYATAHADYISNSWSGGESSGESSYDSHFAHAGKVYVFATGDSGYGSQYPATSPYVTAAGGTTLTVASGTTRGWTETAWSGAGSGCSSYEAQPAWQSTVSNITSVCSKRAEADISAVANPSTGVDVYDSYSYQGLSGWLVFGGTSVATPVIATIYAIAGNAATAVPTSTSGASYTYSHTSSFNDVTSGSNGNCGGTDLCTSVVGWDGPTGWGTPNGTGGL